jgi:hypothetical protein
MNMRKNLLFILFLLFLIQASCTKDETPVSGNQIIETTLYGTGPYYAYGFSFSQAKEVSTLEDPGPDITLLADVGIDGTTIRRLMLQTENLKNSFNKYGEYPNATSAETAYNNLTSANVTQWAEWVDTLKSHQVWIFRTGTDRYAKFRIINTVTGQKDGKPYGECTFEWDYQPDGTLTFPGK